MNEIIKHGWVRLAKAYQDNGRSLDFIASRGENISEYTNYVEWMTRNGPIWKLSMTTSEYNDHITEKDQNRKRKHDLAISAVKQLNELSRKANLPQFFTGDIEDRAEVAVFANEFRQTFYEIGQTARIKDMKITPPIVEVAETPEFVIPDEPPDDTIPPTEFGPPNTGHDGYEYAL